MCELKLCWIYLDQRFRYASCVQWKPELFVYGIVFGSIISLGAIGLSLVFGIIRFANFAHGDLMSAGAFVALFMVTGLLAWIGIPDTKFGPLSFGLRIFVITVVAIRRRHFLFLLAFPRW